MPRTIAAGVHDCLFFPPEVIKVYSRVIGACLSCNHGLPGGHDFMRQQKNKMGLCGGDFLAAHIDGMLMGAINGGGGNTPPPPPFSQNSRVA